MTREDFFSLLSEEVGKYKGFLETEAHDWIVKGFIDVNGNVYTITDDTKVISKILEILLIPQLKLFAQKNGLSMEFPTKQNFYPDITFKDVEGNLFAVDLKSSYYTDNVVNGLTLGSYWGYFRERDILRNMDYTYNSYTSHFVLGVLYKRSGQCEMGRTRYSIDELKSIHSVIGDFRFFFQPKWKIAGDVPGSGNTRNIGGVVDIEKLINGTGPFAELGEDVFDDYWMGYFNSADARNAGIGKPRYTNLETYREYLKEQAVKLNKLK